MLKLPFLKNKKIPRVVTEPIDEKLVNASPEELLDDRCVDELMEAVKSSNVQQFRSALEALVINMFEQDGDEDEA